MVESCENTYAINISSKFNIYLSFKWSSLLDFGAAITFNHSVNSAFLYFFRITLDGYICLRTTDWYPCFKSYALNPRIEKRQWKTIQRKVLSSEHNWTLTWGKTSTQVKLAWDFKTSELSHVLSLKHTPFWKIKFEQEKHFILHGNEPQNRNFSLVENPFHM